METSGSATFSDSCDLSDSVDISGGAIGAGDEFS
jgi:hypothetical protein